MTCILGIDPGLAATGVAVIKADGSRLSHLFHEVIKTKSSDNYGDRLSVLYDNLLRIIDVFKPVTAGMESLYFARNSSSAIPVAQAKGVILLCLSQKHVPVKEYPPQAIKQAIVGQGRAEKRQVQELVKVILGLSEVPSPDHAADALATAICHYHSIQIPLSL